MEENKSLELLLVDDEVEIGGFLKEELQRKGVKVDYVLTTAEALGLLDTKKYDIVLTDLNQVPTGIEVYKRAKERGADAYIITGGGSHVLMDQAQEVAGNHLITKPFSIKQIYEIIEKYKPKEKPQS